MLHLGIASMDELLARMPESDLENFLALDYLQPYTPQRADLRAVKIVQSLEQIIKILTGDKRDIPTMKDILPAPIERTTEAQLAEIEELKKEVPRKLEFLFGHLIREAEEKEKRDGERLRDSDSPTG